MLVPPLSQLRQQAGQEAYATNAVEAINKMLNEASNPAGANCLICQKLTRQQADWTVVCERPWHKQPKAAWANAVLTALGAVANLGIWRMSENSQSEPVAHGREVIVKTPFPLCERCALEVNHADILSQFRKVPAYERLLKEYPDAQVLTQR
jgi:hypothetical protein